MAVDPSDSYALHHADKLEAKGVDVVVKGVEQVEAEVGGKEGGGQEGEATGRQGDGGAWRMPADDSIISAAPGGKA